MKSSSLYGYFKIQLLSDLRTRRQDYVCLFLFAILLHILTAGIWHPMPDTGLYINQARNLIQGQGLTHANMTRWIASPGYPVLISPFFLFSDLPLVALTYFQAATTTLYMFGVYIWASRFTPKSAALITGAAALHAAVLEYCFPLTTEASFMATMIWSVVFLSLWNDHRQTRLGRQAFMAALIMMCCCVLIRPAGLMIALGGGMMILLSDRQHGRSLFNSAKVIVVWLGAPSLIFLGFMLHEIVHSHNGIVNGTYLNGMVPPETMSVTDMLLTGLQKRITDLGRLMIPGMFKAYSRHKLWLHVTMSIYVPLIIFMGYIWYQLTRRFRPDALLWAVLPYIILHLFYSKFDDGSRFMTPLLPVLMLMTWYMAGTFKISRHTMMLVVFVLHASFVIGAAIHKQPTLVAVDKQWETAKKCAQLINADPGLVILPDNIKSLRQQVRILTDTNFLRISSVSQIEQYAPCWILMLASSKPIPNHTRMWANEHFQLLKCSRSGTADAAVNSQR